MILEVSTELCPCLFEVQPKSVKDLMEFAVRHSYIKTDEALWSSGNMV